MERGQKNKLIREFGEPPAGTRLVVLGIRDAFERMDPTLVAQLTAKSERWRATPAGRPRR